MGVVAIAALVVSVAYLWWFGDDQGIVPFLVAAALLLIAVVHGVAWRESRSPLLIADLTGVRVRLGGQWTGLPWSAVDRIEVNERGRLGDGRVTVFPRDELRALAETTRRSRFAVMLNRWLYDAPLAVPYGLTTTVSEPDVVMTLTHLADGRVPIILAEENTAEPEPTVEVAEAGTLYRDHSDDAADEATSADREPSWFGFGRHDGDSSEPALASGAAPVVQEWGDSDPLQPEQPAPQPTPAPAPPRRLAAVVSALRHQAGRVTSTNPALPSPPEPMVVGTLALSDPSQEVTEPLPEVSELRRQAPETTADDLADPQDESAETGEPERSPHTSNVALIIDATTDLSAQAMRRVRRPVTLPASLVAATDTAKTPLDPDSEHLDATPAEAIGLQVSRGREWLGMSVDDLAERTRIRPSVIESIEAGDFAPCGGDFYARGHLRMLAGVLGIDAEPLLATYDAHVAGAPISPRAVFDAELSTGVVRPTGGSGSRWGALIGAVLVLLLVWGLAKFFLDAPTPGSTARSTSVSTSGLGSPGAGNTLLPPPPAPAQARVTLSTTTGTSRVVVRDTNMKILFQGLLQPGSTKTVSGAGPLRVMATDAGAVLMTAPGHPKAPMGQPGQRAFRHVR